MFAGNFAPRDWALCNGQLMAISENNALFALLGTTYGGDGQNTFALPDLRGRLPVAQTSGFAMGQQSGVESVTLTSNQMPVHSHALRASTATGTQSSPAGNVPAQPTAADIYIEDTATVPLGGLTTGAGSSQPHDNLMPYLCINYIISLFGIFPSQN